MRLGEQLDSVVCHLGSTLSTHKKKSIAVPLVLYSKIQAQRRLTAAVTRDMAMVGLSEWLSNEW